MKEELIEELKQARDYFNKPGHCTCDTDVGHMCECCHFSALMSDSINRIEGLKARLKMVRGQRDLHVRESNGLRRRLGK